MRFTSFIAAGLFAIAAQAASETATATASVDPAQSSDTSKIEQCLAACDQSDTACRAHCIAVPSPDNQSVNATNNCVANCPAGNGTAADNKAYSDCVTGCIAEFYFTSTGTPNLATGKPDSGNSGSSTGSASPHVTHISTTIVTDGTTMVTNFASTVQPTGSAQASATSTSSHGAAAVFGPVGSGLGLFGLIAGIFAL